MARPRPWPCGILFTGTHGAGHLVWPALWCEAAPKRMLDMKVFSEDEHVSMNSCGPGARTITLMTRGGAATTNRCPYDRRPPSTAGAFL